MLSVYVFFVSCVARVLARWYMYLLVSVCVIPSFGSCFDVRVVFLCLYLFVLVCSCLFACKCLSVFVCLCLADFVCHYLMYVLLSFVGLTV